MDSYLKYSKVVDVPVNEIFVDAKFIEVNLDNNLKIGLDYTAGRTAPDAISLNSSSPACHNWEKSRGASSIFNR